MLRRLLAATAFVAVSVGIVGCAQTPEQTPPATPPATPAASSETPKTTGTTDADQAKAAADAQKMGAATAPSTAQDAPKEGDDVAVVTTAKGKIVFQFITDKAPKAVENFKDLAKSGFYDGTRFHRCITGFMIQGGDPNTKSLSKADTWGQGGHVVDGQEKTIDDEFSDVDHKRGIVSMANTNQPHSSSSQFFVVTTDSSFLNGKYIAFGKVVEGMDVADQIVATGDPNNNGAVDPGKAVVVKSIKIAKWPLSGDKPEKTPAN